MTDYLRGVLKRLYTKFGRWYSDTLGLYVFDNLHRIPEGLKRPACYLLFRVAVILSPGETWEENRDMVKECIEQAIKRTSKLQRFLDGKD